MKRFKVKYYDMIMDDAPVYVMEAKVHDNFSGESIYLGASIDPHDYDMVGFVEDDVGAYFDEAMADENCFEALRDMILERAKEENIDPDCLIFSRLRKSR